MSELSPAEIRQACEELAAIHRWAYRLGLHEGICNHFSLAVSADGARFLVNPHGVMWSKMRASDILLVRADGTVEEGDAEPEDTAFFIHSRIHLKASHARCVLHTHMPYATALTSLAEGRIEPINQNGLRFYNRVAYDDDYNGLALDRDEGDRLAAALGDKPVLFSANHGVTVVGKSVAEAFDTLYYLERTCHNQVLAMTTGRPLKRVDAQTAERAARQIESTAENAYRHLAAIRRVLDEEEPDYTA